MKNMYPAFILSMLSCFCFSQQRFKISYDELRTYEGIYQYINNTSLKIAASPKDTVLYAIINQSKYALKPSKKDVFLNTSKESVIFLRNKSGAVTGYATGKDTFNLLSKKVFFPREMWYPRLTASGKTYSYQYHVPKEYNDGLRTASLEKSGLDKALLTAMVNKIVAGDYANVHSVLILKNNKLVFEEYFYQYTKDSLHELRSASKSFVSALTGIAIDKGIIKSKDERVVSFFPEYKLANQSEGKGRITIEHLLTNQSGLDCDISNEKSLGNETAMNYSDDWVKFTLDLPMSDVPGGKGMYCSGNPITLGRIIEKESGEALPLFARHNLFEPLGIKNFKWDFKPTKENAEDFCQVYLRPRDMAKFGLLYLNKGKWGNKQVIPKEWVKQSLSKHSVIQNVNYGYLWWLKYLDAGGMRYNGISAQGNGGQRIYIVPDQDLIVVITGGNYNSKSPSDELISKYILAAFSKK
jgi:CubicO group peptidase (beta-lactamase class C family)